MRQKDTDAKWTRKDSINFFGYKNHIKADSKTKLITGYLATPANVNDGQVIGDLLTRKEDGGQPLYADNAYRSEAIEEMCRKKKIVSRIHERGYRHKKITEAQKRSNRKKSKVRARVEHIFGFMTNSMPEMFLGYRNFVRNRAAIGLMNLTYNLFRLVQLKKEPAK